MDIPAGRFDERVVLGIEQIHGDDRGQRATQRDHKSHAQGR